MNPVIDAIRKVLPTQQREKASGWITFDCPSCSDKRHRAAMRFTETGGFYYKCFNGGCEYQKTGWEPDFGGFFGRPRRLFELLGGSVSDIPLPLLLGHPKPRVDSVPMFNSGSGQRYIDYLMSDETAVRLRPLIPLATDFPEIALPRDWTLLFGEGRPAANKSRRACQSYVLNRGAFFVDHPFLWSPAYPAHVIYPLSHRNKIIGWIGRCVEEGRPPHLKCPQFPNDFMFNQEHAYRRNLVLVQEGLFDAIALGSLCTFGNTLSRKQINLLNHLKSNGRRIVLLPDLQGEEWMPYWRAAVDNRWWLSVPTYPYSGAGAEHIKDAGDSIRRNGLLLTAEAIVDGITDDYVEARTKLIMHSGGV